MSMRQTTPGDANSGWEALRGRLDVSLSPAAQDRIHAAVAAEARLWQQARRRRAWRRGAVGLAAAGLLLAAALPRHMSGLSQSAAPVDADALLADWAAALDASQDQVEALFVAGARSGAARIGEDGEADSLETLETSFESLEAVLGA